MDVPNILPIRHGEVHVIEHGDLGAKRKTLRQHDTERLTTRCRETRAIRPVRLNMPLQRSM